MGSAARGSGGALLRGLCRATTRRSSVHASSSFDGSFLGERIHQAKQDMSRLLSMSLMKRMSPFFAGRIRENHRLLSSSFASALHEVSSSPSPSVDDVHMTDACILRMKELQAAEGLLKEKKMLRLSVETGGCSGFELLRKSVTNFKRQRNGSLWITSKQMPRRRMTCRRTIRSRIVSPWWWWRSITKIPAYPGTGLQEQTLNLNSVTSRAGA
ncbi:uncharacterized protein LOC108958513 isoform X1 [Eucalyptus grandis]|uniref:uncharacterized protein LOC108958513 isoform X1 n=1 Tax=Eucalyptus grandis TaxID=71139 RepID=UPI00192EFF58|nr:uncharacterized protein LOC108958513 isoform X1 [Eucalyptus grandis]